MSQAQQTRMEGVQETLLLRSFPCSPAADQVPRPARPGWSSPPRLFPASQNRFLGLDNPDRVSQLPALTDLKQEHRSGHLRAGQPAERQAVVSEGKAVWKVHPRGANLV